MNIAAIILAAGQGKRMHSSLPKVLHQLAKKSLLEHVMTAVEAVRPKQTVVVCGYKVELVKKSLPKFQVDFAIQEKQLGTADAVKAALPFLERVNKVLILCGDVPLITGRTLLNLINNTPKESIGLLTCLSKEPAGFGRIVRDSNNKVIKIIEEKDATKEQKEIKEINTGIYLIPCDNLSPFLSKIHNDNEQGELYLTDVIEIASKEGVNIHTETASTAEEVMGINTREQLADLERYYQKQLATNLMSKGVTILDPSRIDIRGKVNIAEDVIIDINVVLEGEVTIEKNVIIGPNVFIKDSYIGSGVEILSNSVIEGANIGSDCKLGPFARIRSGTVLQKNVKIGNFVEVKNSEIESNSKINHLSYIGDAEIGKQVNIGAGVITCNYDGFRKYRTTIGDNVFVGSDVQLIAPVTIGFNSTIAAGTTVMKDVPKDVLALNQKDQQHVVGWAREKTSAKEKEKEV